MRNIFVISDTHFNHANIIRYCNRPFESVEHMNEAMITNWNSMVKHKDIVYHLGDVYFGSQKEADEILYRLHGEKRLILGNHDNGKDTVLQKHFQKIMLWRDFMEFGLHLTHVPIHQSSILHDRINVHGHIHDKQSPDGPYKCLCVEHTEYKPVPIEEIRL